MKKPPAVVIKLDCRTGLQTARILSRYQIPVIGIVDDPANFCSRTNSCKEILVTNTSDERLVDTLLSLALKIQDKAVLFPISDQSVQVVSDNRERLGEYYHFVIPDGNILTLFMNKTNFYKYAQKKSLPIPNTYFPRTKAELDEVADRIQFPCIVKPAIRTGTDIWFDHFSNKVIKINNPQELYDVFDRCLIASENIIVQDWIKGNDSNLLSSIFYYDSNYNPVITFTSRKLRQWPIENGDASLAIECRNDEVLNQTTEVLSSVKFKGLGSIEFKMDNSSGRYFIIEPNIGRPVTRIGLVEKAGVEILYTMYCDALGLALPSKTKQQFKGIKWISINNDIRAAMAYYKNGELTIWEWFKSIQGVKAFADLSVRDPMPFLIETLYPLKKFLWQLRQKLARAIFRI